MRFRGRVAGFGQYAHSTTEPPAAGSAIAGPGSAAHLGSLSRHRSNWPGQRSHTGEAAASVLAGVDALEACFDAGDALLTHGTSPNLSSRPRATPNQLLAPAHRDGGSDRESPLTFLSTLSASSIRQFGNFRDHQFHLFPEPPNQFANLLMIAFHQHGRSFNLRPVLSPPPSLIDQMVRIQPANSNVPDRRPRGAHQPTGHRIFKYSGKASR